MLHDIALYKFNIHIHIHIYCSGFRGRAVKAKVTAKSDISAESRRRVDAPRYISAYNNHHHHQFIWIKPNTNAKAMQALTGITVTYMTE